MAAMPDWTYQTIFRPALMRLGVDRDRRLALGAIRRLAQTPGGRGGELRLPGRSGLGTRSGVAAATCRASRFGGLKLTAQRSDWSGRRRQLGCRQARFPAHSAQSRRHAVCLIYTSRSDCFERYDAA